MLALNVALFRLEPTRRGIPYPASVKIFHIDVNSIRVILPPALVKDGVVDDTRVIIEQRNCLSSAVFKNLSSAF